MQQPLRGIKPFAIMEGACLRVEPTKNNQAKGVRWAKGYMLSGMVEVAAAAG